MLTIGPGFGNYEAAIIKEFAKLDVYFDSILAFEPNPQTFEALQKSVLEVFII